MFYTDIQRLRGLERPVDYGSGVEYADGLVDAVDGLQIGLWLEGAEGCRNITDGLLDYQIDRLYQWIHDAPLRKSFCASVTNLTIPIFGTRTIQPPIAPPFEPWSIVGADKPTRQSLSGIRGPPAYHHPPPCWTFIRATTTWIGLVSVSLINSIRTVRWGITPQWTSYWILPPPTTNPS